MALRSQAGMGTLLEVSSTVDVVDPFPHAFHRCLPSTASEPTINITPVAENRAQACDIAAESEHVGDVRVEFRETASDGDASQTRRSCDAMQAYPENVGEARERRERCDGTRNDRVTRLIVTTSGAALGGRTNKRKRAARPPPRLNRHQRRVSAVLCFVWKTEAIQWKDDRVASKSMMFPSI